MSEGRYPQRIPALVVRGVLAAGKGTYIMELRTPRLILREWREDDFDFSLALATDPEVMRYASRELMNPEVVRRRLGQRSASAKMQPRTYVGLAVTLAETGEAIGRCGLYLI